MAKKDYDWIDTASNRILEDNDLLPKKPTISKKKVLIWKKRQHEDRARIRNDSQKHQGGTTEPVPTSIVGYFGENHRHPVHHSRSSHRDRSDSPTSVVNHPNGLDPPDFADSES